MKCASLLLCSVGLALGGCTYSVHQGAVGGVEGLPAGAQVRLIESTASIDVVLGIGGDTDFVDEAWESLLAQCPGQIVAIETRYSTAHNFLSYDDNIRMTGLCVESVTPEAPDAPPPPAPSKSKGGFDRTSFEVGDKVLVDVEGRSVVAEVLQAPGDAYFVRLEGDAEGAGRWIEPSLIRGRVEEM